MSDPPASAPHTLADFETLARRHLSHMAFEYVAAGAGDEITLADNERAFDRIRLQPRVLTDVSSIDLSVTLSNQRLEHPILLAPTAYQRLVFARMLRTTVELLPAD